MGEIIWKCESGEVVGGGFTGEGGDGMGVCLCVCVCWLGMLGVGGCTG